MYERHVLEIPSFVTFRGYVIRKLYHVTAKDGLVEKSSLKSWRAVTSQFLVRAKERQVDYHVSGQLASITEHS
jgi:hypothetical protein